MKTKFRIVSLFIFLLILFPCRSQDTDSLKLILKNAKHDTTRCKVLGSLIESEGDEKVWSLYNDQLLKLCEGNLKTTTGSLHITFLKYYANALSNSGMICDIRGDIPKALDYYERCLKIMEETGAEHDLAGVFNNMAVLYENQGDDSAAIEYVNKSLVIRQKIGDTVGIALSLSNMSVLYAHRGEFKKANIYLQKSLRLQEAIGEKLGLVYILSNLGKVNYELNNFKEAFNYFKRGIDICRKLGDKKALVVLYTDFCSISGAKGQYAIARAYADSALKLARARNFFENIITLEIKLAKLDSMTGNFNGAFQHYKQYIIYRDSLGNEENRKASFKSQIKYDFEKKEAVLNAKREDERKLAEEKSRFQLVIIWSVAGGLILLAAFSVFIFRSLQRNKKANKIITAQKEEVEKQKHFVEEKNHIIEEKQKEILDSIHYAKRIQSALLPSEKYVDRSLNRLKDKNT